MRKSGSAPNLASLNATKSVVPTVNSMRKSTSTSAFDSLVTLAKTFAEEVQVEAVLHVPTVVARQCGVFPSSVLEKEKEKSNGASSQVIDLGTCLATPFEPGGETTIRTNNNDPAECAYRLEKYSKLLRAVRRRRREQQPPPD
jgi:hypothetical protein